MKAYNEYMDKIVVSDTLHRKLVSGASDVTSVHRPFVVRRYTAVFACLAVILLGVMTVPRLLQSNTSITPENTPSASQPGAAIPTPGTAIPTSGTADYALVFNKADSQLSTDNVYIPGHFWQELTSDELQAVYHGMTEIYTVTATANFRGDGTLFNIAAHAVSTSGCVAYIQVAPGEVTLDYGIEGKVKTSDIRGVAVTAGYFESKSGDIYFASFELDGIGYYVELSGDEAEKSELPVLLDLIIEGGSADLDVLDPVIPELREDVLDLNEARADTDFGAYLPVMLPDGFHFESALRFINQEQDSLSALWIKGMGNINWRISVRGEDDEARITSVADTQNYDLSLYPIPRADSVPDELWDIVTNPIFLSEDLTLEAVQARAYEVSDQGDEPGYRMRFGVLYGDILIEINIKGVTPGTVFEMLQQIMK